jgi:filamentous hemagglutinin family protein
MISGHSNENLISNSFSLKKRIPFLFFRNLLIAFLIWLIGGWPTIVFALPSGGQIVSGSGTIVETSDTQLDINQNSSQLIATFNNFNTAANETVNVNQQYTSDTFLAKVLGSDPTLFLGKLNAKGQVFITNGSGVFFGPGSQIDVHGLVATTMDISSQDFLDRNYQFSQNLENPLSSVINEGVISATSYVGLLAPAVENRGTIVTASLGSIDLASGTAATMDFTGDGLIQFEVTQAVSGTVLDKDGNELEDRVSNTGLLHADGGQIRMSAKDAGDVIRHVVNMEGMIKANSVVEKNGKVFLMGGDSGVVNVSGTIETKGDDAGEKGGQVVVLGEKVGLFDQAKIDASGDAGGGEILLGGEQQGATAVEGQMNADFLYMDDDVEINADALTNGDGGRIITWATDTNRAYANIYARGGALSGDGGFVEISGGKYFEIGQVPDVTAVNGTAGHWLIDPTGNDLSIVAGGGNTNINAANPFATTNDGASVGWNLILAALIAGTSVTVTTTTGGTNSESGNIIVSTDLDYNGVGTGKSLTLTALGDITFSNKIFDSSGTDDILNLNLNSGGAIAFNASGNVISGDLVASTLDGVGGSFTIGSSADLSVAGTGSSSITAFDFVFDAALNFTGTGTFSLNQSSSSTTFGIGTTTCQTTSCDTDIDNAELNRITVANGTLEFNGSSKIFVNSVAAANTDQINQVTLTQSTGQIEFEAGTGNTFTDLTANAANGIAVNDDVTTTGNMAMDGDSNNSSDGTDSIIVTGSTLSSSGTMTLDATTGGITTSGTATFSATSGMTVNDTLSITTGTAIFSSATSINDLALSGGTLQADGAVSVTSGFTWSGGSTISGSGSFTTTSGVTAGTIGSSVVAIASVAQWDNDGTITWSPGGASNFTVSGIFNNNSGANFNIVNAGSANITGGGTFNNIGTMAVSGGAANTNIIPTFNNSGTVNVNASDLILDTAGVDTGSYVVASGAVLNFSNNSGTRDLQSGSSVTGAGDVTFEQAGGTRSIAGTYNITGTTMLSSGTNNFTGSNVTGLGTLNVSGGTADFSTGNAFSLANLTLASGATFQGSDNITITSTFTWTGGDFDGTGTLTTDAGATATLGNTNTNLNRVWNNNGTLNWTSGSNPAFNINSTLNNNSGANFNIVNTGTSSIGGTGTVNNIGTMTSTGTSNTTFSTTTFINTGAVSVTGTGSLILTSSATVTDTGDYAVSSGTKIDFSSGTRTFSSTTDFTGLGTVDWGGGTMTVNGSTFASTLTALVSGGTVNIDADTTIPTLSISGGVLNLNGATVDLTVNNGFTWTNGNMTGTAGSTFTTTAGVTGGTITNTGLVSLTDIIWNNSGKINWGGSNDLSMIGTTVNNTGTFDITITAGADILNSSSSVFNNSGTLTHNSTSATSFRPEFNNTGQVNVESSGNLTIFSAAGSTDTGYYEVTSATLFFGGSRTFDGSNFSGAGTVEFTSGTFTTNTTLVFEDLNTTFTQTIDGTGTVLFTASAGNTIGVGAGAGTVSVTDAELDQITTTNVIIGNSSAGTVTVDSVSNTTSTLSIISGADVAFSGGASSFTGNFAVAAGNDITQAASLSVTGTSSFTVTGTNTMTLDNGSNDFTGAVSLFSGTGLVKITDINNLELAASTLGGALTVEANGSITTSGNVTTAGATSIIADFDTNGSGDFSIDAAFNTGNNDLTVTANDVTINISGAATLNVGTGKATFAVSDGGTIGVGDSTCGGTCGMQISGSELEAITAANLEIGDSGAGAMTIENVTLANTANISNTLTLISGSTVDFENTASSFTSSLTVSAGSNISQGVAITVAGGTSSFTNTTGNITMNNASNDLGTNLTVSTIGNIDVVTTSDLADLTMTVTPTGSSTYSVTATNLTFNVTESSTVTITDVKDTTGLNFSFTTNTAGIILADNAIDVVDGNVALTAIAAGITDPSGTTTANITTTGAVSLTAGTSIGTSSGNGEVDIASATDLTFSVGNDLYIRGDGTTTITNLDVSVKANAAGPPIYTISNIAGQTFTMTSDGTDLTVTNVSNTSAINLSITAQTGNIILADDAIDVVSGNVTLTSTLGSINELNNNATANITTTGSVSLAGETGIGNTSTLDVASTTNLSIDTDNSFDVDLGGTTLTDLTISIDPANASTYVLSNVSNISAYTLSELSGDTNFSITATALNFSLSTDNGAISTVGAIDVGTGSLSITNNDTTVGSSITIANSHTVAAGSLTITANGQFSDININENVTITSGDVTLIADDAVNFSSGKGISATGSGNVVVTANNNVTDGNSLDVISMSGSSFIDAGSGTITLTAVGTNSGNNILRKLDTTSNSSSALVINALGNVSFNDAVNISGDVSVTSATGNISQTTALTIGGTSTFDTSASTGTITLTDSSNDFTGAVSAKAGNGLVQITDTNAFIFGTSTTTGEIAVVAGGAVTQTGAITADGLAVTTTGSGAITLENVLNDVDHLSTSATGNVSYVDADGFGVSTVNSVDGVSTSSGSVHLTATTGNVSVENTAAANDIDATAGISITLSGTDAIFHIASSADVENNSSGDIDVTADNMDIAGTITASGQRVTLKSKTDGDAVNLGFLNNTASNTLELSDAELYAITANYLEIGSTTQGAFTVSSDVRPANVMVAHLISNSTVTGTAGGIVATQLAIEAGGEVNFTDTTTDVDNLAISASGFDVTFYDVDDLDINTVDTVVGVKAKSFTTDGPGPLTETSAVVLEDSGAEEAALVEEADEVGDAAFLVDFSAPAGC